MNRRFFNQLFLTSIINTNKRFKVIRIPPPKNQTLWLPRNGKIVSWQNYDNYTDHHPWLIHQCVFHNESKLLINYYIACLLWGHIDSSIGIIEVPPIGSIITKHNKKYIVNTFSLGCIWEPI